MKYIYNLCLVLILLLVNHMVFGQLNWGYINPYERGGEDVSSTVGYTGTTILSNGNVLGCGLNAVEDFDSEGSENPGIFGIMTLLSSEGQLIKDTLMEPGLFNYPIYVKDIPDDKSFYTVNWDLQSNSWFVLYWSYDLVLKSTNTIDFDYDGDIDEFTLFRYSEMKNGNIILNSFFESEEFNYVSIMIILDTKGIVIDKKVFKTVNVFNILEKQDQSGFWGIGLDLVDFDNDFNITNVRKDVFIDKDEINVLNYKDKVIVSYIIYEDDVENWKLDVMDSELNLLKSVDLINSNYFLNFNHNSIDIDDKGYIYLGISDIDEDSNFGIQLIKLDEQFDIVWEKRIVNQGYEFLGLNLEVNAKGEILIGGLAYTLESDNTGFGIILNVNNEKSSGTKDKNTKLKSITLYPNPAKNIIWIASERELTGTYVEIVDVSGKFIYSTNLSADHSIDVGRLENGLYFAKFDLVMTGIVSIPFIKE